MTDFFSTRERLAGLGTSVPAEPITPGELNRMVERALKANLPPSILVKGEISNFTRNRSSGHLYFTLKDAQASVECVMFAQRAARVGFDPQDGLEVVATGAVGVYAPRGRYQLVVSALEPLGAGSLELARRKLEQKLRDEGLLDPSRRKPIPPFAQTVALITSPQAAGFADMMKVLQRCPWLALVVCPVPVQGASAAAEIVKMLRTVDRRAPSLGIDVVLLGRGGGSIEDLWAFNDETLARTIVAMHVPVVTGIGHEIDVSIADLVADYHAHTPTEAATVIVRNWLDIGQGLDAIGARLSRAMRTVLQSKRHQLSMIERVEFFRHPSAPIDLVRQQIDDRAERLDDAMRTRLERLTRRLEHASTRLTARHPRLDLARAVALFSSLEARLDRSHRPAVERRRHQIDAIEQRLVALDPMRVLKRGYSITRRPDGRIVRTPGEVREGDRLTTRLAEGEVESIVESKGQGRLF
jgi:exodeoxyribonuclease VII large subunit